METQDKYTRFKVVKMVEEVWRSVVEVVAKTPEEALEDMKKGQGQGRYFSEDRKTLSAVETYKVEAITE